ncbi:MAG: hypothetical protein D6706_03995 [Chloroflexi bacterium]|nr:MAG: hypothetical protein D6706_03995 [Chloroflexota bacterium]
MKRQFLILLIFVILFTHPQLTRAQSSEPLTATFADFGNNEITLRGMFGYGSAWIPLQSNWHINQPMQVTLRYIASPLLHPFRTTVTVLANGQEVASFRLAENSSLEQTQTFTIPPNLLRGDGVSLQFNGFLRLTDAECEETNNPGQWLTILDSSTITFLPEPVTNMPDLAELDREIVVRNQVLGNVPVIFVLPDAPDQNVLTVAGKIAARLGRESGSHLMPFAVETADSLTMTQRESANLVVIGTPATQPLIAEMAAALPARLVQDGFVTADNRLSHDGVIQLFASPWNSGRRVLLVSGGDEDALMQAGEVFADDEAFQALHGRYQFVRELPETAVVTPPPPWQNNIATFAQLGDRDRTIEGTGIFEEYYFFRRPPGWIFDNGSRLTLHIATSPALRPQDSYIAAFINDIHIGTVRVGEGVETGDVVSFDLPVALINETASGARPQTLVLRLVVASFMAETLCEQTHPQAAWIRVYADSFFEVPHVYMGLPDLAAFPYPFVSDKPEAPVSLVVPPAPTVAEIAQALNLAAVLGRYAPAEFELVVETADTVTPTSHSQHHLIILGTRNRQPLIDELLTELSDVPGFQEDDGLYQALTGDNTAVLREAPSPWGNDRVILLVLARTENGAQLALDLLYNRTPPTEHPGSVLLVEDGLRAQILYRSVEISPSPRMNEVAREPVVSPPPPWVVITGVLVLTTLIVLGIVYWYTRRGLE